MKQSDIAWKCVFGAALGLSGCVDAGATIQVLRNQQPGIGCVVPATLSATFLPRGRIESSAAAGYLFTPLIESRAVQSANADRVVFVKGANVDLQFVDGFFSDAEVTSFSDGGLSRFRQPFSGSIAPGGLTSFAFEVIPKAMLEVIDGKLAEGESTQVIAEVEILGSMDGGDVESNLFSYPIEVCKGCLVRNLGSCDALPADPVNTGGSCQLLQDGLLDCCTDAEGGLVCPASNPG